MKDVYMMTLHYETLNNITDENNDGTKFLIRKIQK